VTTHHWDQWYGSEWSPVAAMWITPDPTRLGHTSSQLASAADCVASTANLTHHQTGRQARTCVRDVQVFARRRTKQGVALARTGHMPQRPGAAAGRPASPRACMRARTGRGPGPRPLSLARSSGRRPVRSRRRRACMPARHAARAALAWAWHCIPTCSLASTMGGVMHAWRSVSFRSARPS